MRVRTAAALLLLGCLAGCAGSDAPSLALDSHYRDQAGWSLRFPDWMHLERSQIGSRVQIHEVTVASFAPSRAIRSGSNAQGGTWIKIDPPRPSSGSFPADGVAFRVYRLEGGPPVIRKEPATRFPLHLRQFRASRDYPSSRPRPVGMGVTTEGGNYAVYAWTGPKASSRERAALASVVESLSFPHP